MFSLMLGIIHKLANAGGYLDKNPVYKLLTNTLLYIPCLLFSAFNSIRNQTLPAMSKEPIKPSEVKILLISLFVESITDCCSLVP